MPMVPADLADLMEQQIDAAQPGSELSDEGRAERKKMLTAMATAIVAFLQTKMTITIAQPGLQTTTGPGSPTGPPPGPMPLLPGSIT